MCISMYYMSLRYHGNGFVAKKWKKICLRAYTSAGSSEPMSLRPINSRLCKTVGTRTSIYAYDEYFLG